MGRVLALRTSGEDGTSHGGFRWPESGFVEAPDFSCEPTCGRGLHALLWGEGEAGNLRWDDPKALWQVVAVESADIIDLGGKIKFPRCEVVHVGTAAPRRPATEAPRRPDTAAPSSYAGGTLSLGSTATVLQVSA